MNTTPKGQGGRNDKSRKAAAGEGSATSGTPGDTRAMKGRARAGPGDSLLHGGLLRWAAVGTRFQG